MSKKEAMQKESIKRVLDILGRKRHQKLDVVIKKVSASGMTRKIKFYYEDYNITGHMANILDWGIDNNDCLIVKGCGMNMVFHTIYCLNGAILRETKAYKNKQDYHKQIYDKYFDSSKYRLL